MTHRAVIAFQRVKALRIDGVVGPKTAAALGLSYNPAPLRPIALPPRGTPRPRLPTALEIIANALAPPMLDFMKLIRGEILKTGAEEDKIQNAVQAMDETITPGMLSAIKDWSQYPMVDTDWMYLQVNILGYLNMILEKIIPYLDRHGGKVKNVVARMDKLDDDAIGRVVKFMLDGRENADAAAWDIQEVMGRALA